MQKMKKGSVIMKELSKRTKTFTDSVIRRMTRIANEYGAINLSQGFPDFDPPQEILNRLSEVAHEDFNQYAITWGAQNFRDALAKKQSKYMNLDLDSNKNIVVTCGSTEAMMAAMMSVCDPSDKVFSLHSMKTMGRIPSFVVLIQFMFLYIHLYSTLIKKN